MRQIASIWLLILFSFTPSAFAHSSEEIDEELKQFVQYIDRDIEKARILLDHLAAEKAQFNIEQSNQFTLYKASYLGFVGRNRERIELVKSVIDQVNDTNLKSKFLYQLSDSYTTLGEYDNALTTMNQSIQLLPYIDRFTAKIGTLQSAINLLLSLRAYDDALSYADRMIDVPSPEGDFQAKCLGYTNRVHINFERGNRIVARSAMKDALDNCNANGRKGIVLILQIYEVVDLIETGSYQQGIKKGVPLIAVFSKNEQAADNFSELLDALARAYLKTGHIDIAESYSLRALQLAKINESIQLLEKINTTMSNIKRAQGQYASALDYYDMSLALKDKILDEQLRKNIAYQRIQFDSKDKANQLVLLEEKNKALLLEQQLERRNNLLLVFLMVAITCLMMSILFWLMKTLKQKNLFRQFSQIDGLTQVANRTHFIHCATEAFDKNPNGMSIILFDMDLFKKVNDTYGHATGDWVLKNVTEVVQAQLRDVDLLGRLGGEEFAICMPDSTVDTAMALAERCRATIAQIDTVTSGYQFDLSASFGVASFCAGPERSFKATLEAADRALYHAKSQGRNCVSAHH